VCGDDGEHGAERGHADHRHDSQHPDRQRRWRFDGVGGHECGGATPPVAVRRLLPSAPDAADSPLRKVLYTAAANGRHFGRA
jgi:hypothetical protein